MKVALCHDWLNGMRGGEKCLEQMIHMYPESKIYTLIQEPEKLSQTISARPITHSWIQNAPMGLKKYKWYLPFFMDAASKMKLDDCDLIVSTNHCVAKSFLKPKKEIPHICYCFTPMRYAWLFFDEYFGGYPKIVQVYIRSLIKKLRQWDVETCSNVDQFVAISEHVQKRIKAFYGRDAEVIYPPADTEFYTPDSTVPREDFYLLVAALVPYKKTDLAIDAFNQCGKNLVVIGQGPDLERLQSKAKSNVKFLGWQSNEQIREHYRRTQALIFPGEEDFGIVPVEAQSCGAPVIAFGEGGALETVVDQKTGLFFNEQTADHLIKTLEDFEKLSWDQKEIRAHAEKFSESRFRKEFEALASSMLSQEPSKS